MMGFPAVFFIKDVRKMPGPKPTPTKILEQRGSWRAKKRQKDGEMEVSPGVPDCPDFLCDDAKQEWFWITEKLAKIGILSEIDKAGLSQYCEAFAEYKRLVKLIRDNNMPSVIKTSKGNPVQNPVFGVKNTAFKNVMKISAEFGLTPSSRTKIKAIDKYDSNGCGRRNKAAKYFNPA